MVINVTAIVQRHLDKNPPASLCTGSAAELGEYAALIAWGTSKMVSAELNICKDDETAEALRDMISEYGSYKPEEIDTFTHVELGAFLVQNVMHDIRTLEEHGEIDLEDFDEEEYQEFAIEDGGVELYGGALCVEGDKDKYKWFYPAG